MKESDVLSIVAGASNIKSGTNPPFTKEDLSIFLNNTVIESAKKFEYVDLN